MSSNKTFIFHFHAIAAAAKYGFIRKKIGIQRTEKNAINCDVLESNWPMNFLQYRDCWGILIISCEIAFPVPIADLFSRSPLITKLVHMQVDSRPNTLFIRFLDVCYFSAVWMKYLFAFYHETTTKVPYICQFIYKHTHWK